MHPAHAGKGIDTTLVTTNEARAREYLLLAPGGVRVTVYSSASGANAAACRLLESRGYSPERHFLRMAISLDRTLTGPEWPASIRVRSFRTGVDERRVHAVSEEAMSDHWGYMPESFEEWSRFAFGATFSPDLWFIAEEDGEPAGIALCSVSGRSGWVDTLAVRRPWRIRRLGMALLRHAMAAFQRDGRERMLLNVDS